MKSVVFALSLLALSGCASTYDTVVFNGESPETIKSDINKVIRSLPTKKKEEFLFALLSIQMSEAKNVLEFLGKPGDDAMNYELLSKRLNGLTYQQALELASKSEVSVQVISD